MTQSKSSRPRNLLSLIAMSAAMMFGTFLLPAYGQQEVSPDWFDPWAPSSAQVAQTSQGKAAKSQPQQQAKVKLVSATRTAKVRVKKNTKQRPS